MNSATRFGLKSFASSSKVSLSLSDLRQPTSGTEIATSTSMEIRYVNPRFLPAFILMPSHSMLIVGDSLRTGRERRRRRLVAVATLLFSFPTSLVSSARPRSRPCPRHKDPACNLALLSSVIVHRGEASDRYVAGSLDEVQSAIC